MAVHPLGLRYPFIFLSNSILICIGAKNITALLQLLKALFFSDLILLSKEVFSTVENIESEETSEEFQPESILNPDERTEVDEAREANLPESTLEGIS